MRPTLLVMLLLTGLAWGDQRLEVANQDYASGRYARAAAGYRALLEKQSTPALWYNLGNAYARLQDYGRARAAYERALALDPRDADLKANLELLKSKLTDKPPAPTRWEALAANFREDELVLFSTVFYWLGAGLLLWQFRRFSRARALGIAACAALFAGSAGLLAVQLREQVGEAAVVLPAEVRVYNGPGKDFSEGVRLHAGTLVYVLKERGDWQEVAALGRVRGWVRGAELEKL